MAKRKKKKKNAHREGFEMGQSRAARIDLRAQGAQASWGTSSNAMGEVLRESEAAKHETCIDCGYGGGRHSRRCGLAPAEDAT